MPAEPPPWTLEDLVDFEQVLAASPEVGVEDKVRVAEAVKGRDGADARRAGLRVWLEQVRKRQAGRAFRRGLAVVGTALAGLMFCAGVSGVLGMVDGARGGVNVVLFGAILIGGQWLVLLVAGIGWSLGDRARGGFSAVQAWVGSMVRRCAGTAGEDAWRGVMDAGGAARAAVLWRIARMVQAAGVFFNLGILAALAGLVLVRHVGFFWETTTENAMRDGLERAVAVLSAPWASGWPEAVPGPAVIEASRWFPGHGAVSSGPAAWWEFLWLATLFWGLGPRLILWCLAWYAGRRALQRLEFQGGAHRRLWRDLTGTLRMDVDEEPMDGVLVLDVGGSGIRAERLRPFLLQRLRVHPAAWQSVAVLDPAAAAQAAAALEKAPAGVVMLAEGWALSPPRMKDLHGRIRELLGAGAPVKFLIANGGSDGEPMAPEPTEQREWERFVDSLRDPAAEVHPYVPDEPPGDDAALHGKLPPAAPTQPPA